MDGTTRAQLPVKAGGGPDDDTFAALAGAGDILWDVDQVLAAATKAVRS